MKLSTRFEQDCEFIPFDKSKNTASNIAQQFLKIAASKIYQQARNRSDVNEQQVLELAHKLANRFHSDVLAQMDQNLNITPQYEPMKRISDKA